MSARPMIMPLVTGARLPLAFIGFGLVTFAVAVAFMVAFPSVLLLPHPHPSVLALAHLWLPGFLLSVCLGAMYQLMPVVLGVPLRTPPALLWTHFALHATGAPMLCIGFALGRFDLVGAGGLLLTAGLLFFAVSSLRTFLGSDRRDAIACSLPLASGWLAVTAGVGVIMAANRHVPFLPLGAIDLLRAHGHLGLAGFYLTLLQGVTFQLVPMFTMGELRRPRWVWTGLGLTQVGLLVLAPGLAFGHHAAAVAGAALIAAGLAASGGALRATLRTRRRRRLEPGLRAFVAGCLLLAGSATLGLTLFTPYAPFAWINLYGLIAVAGGLTLTVLGMILKIVPFLVWMRAYGPSVGKRPVPLTTALSSARLERLWFAGHLTALGLLALAILTGSSASAVVGSWLIAAATGVFLANQARVISHLRRTDQPVFIAPPTATS